MTAGRRSVARHTVLVGLMGAGKTSVGRRLAGSTVPFVDTDSVIEQREGRSVRDIFATDGEPAFRILEEEAVAGSLAEDAPSVIATGGGAMESTATRELVNRARAGGRVFVVWLRAEPGELASRVGGSTHRPLLDADAEGRLTELAAARAANYSAVADLVVDTDGLSPAEVAERVRAAVRGTGQDGADGTERVDE